MNQSFNIPESIIHDKSSGRAIGTLIVNSETRTRFGHVTIMFLGNYWSTLSPQQRLAILQKFGSFKDTKFTVKNVAKGGQSMHFESDELLKIRQEMTAFIHQLGVQYPFDGARGAMHQFHSEMREDDARNANLINGASFILVPSTGFLAKEVARVAK